MGANPVGRKDHFPVAHYLVECFLSRTRVAVLWDPSTGPAQLDAASQAAQSLKLAMYPVEARSTDEIEPAFGAAMRERPAAWFRTVLRDDEVRQG
jgi:hypothetical protein